MSPVALAILLLALVLIEVHLITNGVRKNSFQWWHIPWFGLLYTIAVYLIYHFTKLPDTILLGWIGDSYAKEAFYCLVAWALWMPLKYFLRRPSVHESLIKTYRSLFAKNDVELQKKLPFPYYYSDYDVLKSRVGRVFYRLTLKIVVIIVAVVYAVALIVTHFYPEAFFPISAFGILGLLPLVEYYFYLSTEADEEQEHVDSEGAFLGNSDFDELWKLYVDRFDNYSVAWKRDFDEKGEERKAFERDNNGSFDDLFKNFKDGEQGGIIENCDLLTAFSKLVPFFMHVITKGKYILVVFDIPKHFSTQNYLRDIANALTTVLIRRFPKINEIIKFSVYDETSTLDVFNNSIVMAPLALLARQEMKNKGWMRNLGLITVVNVFDKGVSNLFENRKFGYLLQSVNTSYQIIVVSADRREIEPSLEKTWLTQGTKKLPECPIIRYPRSHRQYFLGYNFEEWEYRLNKVLSGRPNESLYSGNEMLVFPLSSRIGDKEKTITPVHQLELAYTSALEGNEESRKFVTHYKKEEYSVSVESIINHVKPHILPIDEIVESQTFSLIYDNENNAPLAFNKWIHLGNDENFSIVISKPYLFRDYFNANHDYFSRHPFSAVQPRMCNSRITLAIILLGLLRESEQEENTIKGYLLKYYDEKEITSIPEKLRELFSTYFDDNLANDLRTTEEVVFDETGYQTHVKFRLVHPDRVNQPFLDIITIKDGNGNVLFDIYRDLLYQNYNKGQEHSFSGWPYIITDLDSINKTLIVNRSDGIYNVLFYKPCYHIQVNFNKKTSEIKGMEKDRQVIYYHHTGIELAYKLEAFETDISIDTRKWVIFGKCYKAPVFSGGSSKIVPSDQQITPTRDYTKGKILKFSLRYMPQYSDKIDKVRKFMQILFYEGLQSLFPHHAQYLIVASPGEGDTNLPWIFHEFVCNDQQMDGWLTFYFIEDAHIDLGLIGALTYDNIWYLMSYLFDYLMWLTEDAACPGDYIEYLNRKDFDKTSFLKYGNKTLPGYFDIDLAINFIRDHFTIQSGELTQMQQRRHVRANLIGTCDFCRKKMKNSEMQALEDGRMRCPECSEGAVDTNEQFLELCEEVKNAFKKHLGIDFSRISFTPNFVSAVELHKVGNYEFSITNGYDVRECIGLAVGTENIYVENGYKVDATYGIIAHELTHVWEFSNEEFIKVRKTNEDLVEGLAVWTDLFLSEKHDRLDIEGLRSGWLSREDEYGRGLRFIMENCPDDPYGYIRAKAKGM